jgi:UrcA family protein
MNKYTVGSGIALIVVAMLTDVSVADPLEQITVLATNHVERMLTDVSVADPLEQITVLATNHVERSPTGMSTEEISLGVGVSTEGLDLATRAGLNAMEKRVRDAATSACSEISSLSPFAEPSNAECALAAVREPLAEVREAARRARQSG